MAIGEFALIEKYFTGIGHSSHIDLGVGDDCALITPPAGHQLAISVDTLVADVHFPALGNPELIAQKALRSNLSDLAAMGAQPLAFTLALTLPNSNEKWLAAFSRGLRACAQEFDIALIGGDTTRGPQHVITIQVMGSIPNGSALTRSGANVGDIIFITGTLGDARAALDYLSTPMQKLNKAQQFFLQRYYTPTPRVQFAQSLRGIANSAIDISDGLSADLTHILERSNVGAQIELENLPISTALKIHNDAQQFALHGGDDYELCFTAAKSRVEEITALAQKFSIPITAIGEIFKDSGLFARANGNLQPIISAGYTHFS
ncbi:MAG: thiamine-monophosphate kinase [Verrucomicrobiaceae bacterium]|nr:thiamine-monophosphate kinase [Verrucomicrobiaceae bacterium]